MRKDLGKKLIFTPLPVLIIGTYDKDGNPNAMNAAWGIQSDYEEVTITLSEHKTTKNLRETGAFTVSFATKDTITISDYFGIASGNKENKIEKSKVKIEKSKYVNAPIILDYPLTLECKVKSFEGEKLIGDVINISVDEKYLKNGKIDYDKLGIVTFDSVDNTYRIIGESVAKAFSEGLKIK